MLKESGYSENVAVDEGLDPWSNVRTIIRFEGDELIIQKQQDMEPILRHVQEMRERNLGKGWGEGKSVGYIPPLFYDKINSIIDRQDRQKAIKRFFKAYPAFCAYDAFLKD